MRPYCRCSRPAGREGILHQGIAAITIAIMLCLAGPARAADAPPAPAQQLQTVLSSLSEHLNRADAIAKRLRDTAKEGPEQGKEQIERASKALGDIADRLRDGGDLLVQLHALRNAAQAHRDRVKSMHGISEEARSEVLARWTSFLQETDKTEAAVKTMRQRILSVLTSLRQVEVDVSELVLVGSYEDALKSLNDWLNDLTRTVDSVRATINAVAPHSPGV